MVEVFDWWFRVEESSAVPALLEGSRVQGFGFKI